MSRRNPRLIFDIGMHLGEDTEYYLKKGYDVISFEANPELVEHCTSRFVEEIENGRLRIVSGAIADAERGATITFYKSELSVWGTVEPTWDERNQELGAGSGAIQVRRIDMCESFRTFGIPFYLKIDVEGSDAVVLASLREFSARPQYVSVESNKVDFAELEAELQTLADLGYTKFKAVQQAGMGGRHVDSLDIHGSPVSHTFAAHASGPFGEDIAQPWLNLDEVRREYTRIFKLYALVGDHSPMRVKGGHQFISELESALGIPLPGWYDTHASL